MELAAILENARVTLVEYVVMWEVRDTVVAPRRVLAEHVASTLPNFAPPEISVDDCLRAIAALIERELLVELSATEIERDLARWRAEPLPTSFGVHLERRPGDVDFTQAGFDVEDAITRQQYRSPRTPLMGYDDSSANLIRAFGETEDTCRRQAEHVRSRLRVWQTDSVIRPLGPWWYSRFELVPDGFEIVLRPVSA